MGVVASSLGIATFAGTLVKSVIKLKGFCANTRDAPAELDDLLDRLENLAIIISDFESESVREAGITPNATHIHKALSMCQNALQRINETALQLHSEICRRKCRGALKTVLKRDTIETLLRKLDRSERDLDLAISFYTSIQTASSGSSTKCEMIRLRLIRAITV